MIIPTRRQRGVNAVRATTVALFFRCRRRRHLGRGVPTTKWPFPACFPRKIVRDRLLFLRHTVVSFPPEVTTYRVTRSTDLSVCVCVCVWCWLSENPRSPGVNNYATVHADPYVLLLFTYNLGKIRNLHTTTLTTRSFFKPVVLEIQIPRTLPRQAGLPLKPKREIRHWHDLYR